MSKALVIVESPNKVATINKFLGDEYIVASSVGHIRDLVSPPAADIPKQRGLKLSPEEKLDIQVMKMGINPKNWDGNFQIMDEKIRVVNDLKKLAKQCGTVYLATDLDREGEAIAWHLQEVLGNKNTYKRVTFNEITKTAVTEAFKSPSTVNMNRVHAQQTRRYLDRMVGFLLSHSLWAKAGRGLSAGRVQSVATKMIVNREREIRAFVPIEYWKINGLYKSFVFELLSIDNNRLTSPEDKNPFFIANEEQVNTYVNEITSKKAIIQSIETKDTKVSPKAPFITSTLQQSASTRLGFSIKRTMSIAQKLYESGYITYMRTDSTNLSDQALAMAKSYILDNYGEEYFVPRVFANKKSTIQEAHEAIRPTHLNPTKNLSSEEQKLYDLIKSQFIASQMSDAVYLNTSIQCTVDGKEHNYNFKSSAKLLKFAGFYLAFGIKAENLKDLAGGLKVGTNITLKPDANQSFTQPPARYTEASLVKELESLSIGRPSTYVTIITTIQDRGYVNLENKKFYATKIAEIVTDRLECSFQDILDTSFTAGMELMLDEIATGTENWKNTMSNFWKDFKLEVAQANLPEDKGGMPRKKPIITDLECKVCHKHKMSILTSKQGDFLTCEAYSLKGDDKCENTMSLIDAKTVYGDDYVSSVEHCPKCNSKLTEYFVDLNTKLYVCSNSSRCDYTKVEYGDFINKSQVPIINCDKCNHPMEMKVGAYGKYLKCSACGNTRKILANGEVAPVKPPAIEFPELKCTRQPTAYFVLRHSAKGLFFGANNFPRCREVKSIEISILHQFKERLPEDILYLAEGPVVDSEGNKTILRFSVKENKQYIGSVDANGKFTKFKAEYENGKWVTNEQELVAKKSKSTKSTKTAKVTKTKSTTAKATKVTKSTKSTRTKKTVDKVE